VLGHKHQDLDSDVENLAARFLKANRAEGGLLPFEVPKMAEETLVNQPPYLLLFTHEGLPVYRGNPDYAEAVSPHIPGNADVLVGCMMSQSVRSARAV